MAVLMTTSDSAVFVHRGDTAAVLPGIPAVDSDWLLDIGQPAECTRVRVRALSREELDTAPNVVEVGRRGFIDRDGTMTDFDKILPAWQTSIAVLVGAVTNNPLLVRRFRWMENLPSEAPSQESSPAST